MKDSRLDAILDEIAALFEDQNTVQKLIHLVRIVGLLTPLVFNGHTWKLIEPYWEYVIPAPIFLFFLTSGLSRLPKVPFLMQLALCIFVIAVPMCRGLHKHRHQISQPVFALAQNALFSFLINYGVLLGSVILILILYPTSENFSALPTLPEHLVDDQKG